MKTDEIHIHTDGGARGNPGPAALGVYISDSANKKLAGFGKRLGIQTNNFAEYAAVIEAYKWLLEHRSKFGEQLTVKFFLDSQLVCSQLNGTFKVKNAALLQMGWQVKELQMKLADTVVSYSYVPREKNKEADAYVNLALDKMI